MPTLDALLIAAALSFAAATLVLITTPPRRFEGVLARVGLAVAEQLIVAVPALALGTGASAWGIVALLVCLGSVAAPRRWGASGSVALASIVVTTLIYVAYLVRATFLLGGNWTSLLLGAALLALELGAMALIAAAAFEMLDALCSPRTTPSPPPDPDPWPVVCLQVPAYNEPPELVIETLRSLVALDYPALRVQVIDNNTTDEALWRPLEAECGRLRAEGHAVDFVHLPSWPGYKAGALNWGRTHLAPDVAIVGVVDADYVVDRHFLRATVPYFGDPDVAFVQTPQDYRDWETSGFYRACYEGFAYFFRVGMVSRAHRNAIIFAGTMGLLRRSVLDEIGGWDEAIITEDAEASLRILARGYRGVYLPTPYGRGIMPLTYEGLRKQRFRWAFGGIQILRKHWRALLPWNRASGLTRAQRYDHLVGGLWWFNDALTLGFALFVFAAGIGVLAGRPFVVQRLSAVGLVLPLVFIALNLLRFLWAMRVVSGTRAGLAFAALRVNLSLSWVIAQACVRGLVQEHGVFLRTPKFRGAPAVRELGMVAPETALAGVGLVLAVGVLAVAGYSPVGLMLAALLGWSILIYGSATAYALADPARAPVGETLRQKARLELAPRVGRAIAAPRVRRSLTAGLAAAVLLGVIGLAGESGRPPVQDAAPFGGGLAGPLRPGGPSAVLPGASAAPTSSPSSGGPSGTRHPASTPASLPASTPGAVGSGAPVPSATPAPGATPSASASLPTPAATGTPHPTAPVPTPAPTARPTPPAATSHPVPQPSQTPRAPVPTPTARPKPSVPVPTRRP